jgi:UDP-glucose 4-epimerase
MILLTGATGFLGSTLLPRLALAGDVVALHRPGSDPPRVDGVVWVAQDLTAPLSAQLPRQIDAVIHAGQSRRYREFPDGAADVYEINASATVRLLDYCRRAGGATFTYLSSGAVYAPGSTPARETDLPMPSNFYAMSKLAGELAVEQFRSVLRGHVMRMFFIYGPGQLNMFVPGLVGRVREELDVTLAGPDGIRVNPVYVEDAAAAIAATLDLQESCTLNVAGPDIVSVRRVAELAGQLLDRSPRFVVGDVQPDLIAATDEMQATVGAPRVGFEEGLRRTVTQVG